MPKQCRGKENTERNEELYNQLMEIGKPTEADIRHNLSQDELKELCRHTRCHVLMWRWNPVNDYADRFRREGRLQNKSTKDANKLLAKAVNRHKATHVYTDQQIQSVRQEEWRLRKKENLLLLDLLAYDREQALKEAQLPHPVAISYTSLTITPAEYTDASSSQGTQETQETHDGLAENFMALNTGSMEIASEDLGQLLEREYILAEEAQEERNFRLSLEFTQPQATSTQSQETQPLT